MCTPYGKQIDDIRMPNKLWTCQGIIPSTPVRSWSVLPFPKMKKDSRLTFRVRSTLKKEIEEIATREGQSVARICEVFLLAGSEVYRRRGSKFLHPYLGRLLAKS